MIFKSDSKRKLINFFFPLYPLKSTQYTWSISLLAVLIGLRIALNFVTINIPQFGMTFSLAHTPLMAIGWLFGPVVGFFVGALTDTICYLSKPNGPWYWMFAIQEPLLGMLSGFIGSIYVLRKNKQGNLFDIIFSEIMFIAFLILCVYVLLNLTKEDKFQGGKKPGIDGFFTTYKYIFIGFISFFTLSVQTFLILMFIKKKNKNLKLVIYSITLCLLNSLIFSLLMGPLSAVGLYEFMHQGIKPSAFVKYGYMYYFLARVIKESFRMPIQSILLTTCLFVIIPLFKEKINYAKLTWEHSINSNKYKPSKKIIWI